MSSNRRYALIGHTHTAGTITEANDLTAAVTWANIPDANVPESAVTQHSAAIASAIGWDSSLYAALADNETVTGNWIFQVSSIGDLSVTRDSVGATGIKFADSVGVTGYIGSTTANPFNIYSSAAAVLAYINTAGDWVVDGDLSGATIGGITEANLLDKSAAEAISGAWTFDTAAMVDLRGGTDLWVRDGTNADILKLIETGAYGQIVDTVNPLRFYPTGTYVLELASTLATFTKDILLGTNNDGLWGVDTLATNRWLIGVTGLDMCYIGDVNLSGVQLGHPRLYSKTTREIFWDNNDNWLRINNSSDFTFGIYSPGKLRQDGAVTGGTGGSTWAISTAGAFTGAAFGGILTANLLSRVLAETISGQFTFTDNVIGNKALIANGAIAAESGLGQMSFLDVSGGISRFGGYDFDTASWKSTKMEGTTVEIDANSGLLTLTGTAGIVMNGTVGQINSSGGFNSTSVNSAWGYNITSNFVYDGDNIAHYGMTTYNDSVLGGVTAGLSGYYGLRFFRIGASVGYVDANGWNFEKAVRIYDSGGTDYLDASHDGADFNFQFTNTANVDFQGMTNVRLLAGGVLKIYDGTSADQIQISHGGTDALFNFTNTGDVNFTGLTGYLRQSGYILDNSISEINTQNGAYTLVAADRGKTIHKATSTASITHTIPANASVAFPIGTIVGFKNSGTVDMTIAITTDTLTGTDGSTGSRTLGAYQTACIRKLTATTWEYVATDL